jgi:hypothetical protein
MPTFVALVLSHIHISFEWRSLFLSPYLKCLNLIAALRVVQEGVDHIGEGPEEERIMGTLVTLDLCGMTARPPDRRLEQSRLQTLLG